MRHGITPQAARSVGGVQRHDRLVGHMVAVTSDVARRHAALGVAAGWQGLAKAPAWQQTSWHGRGSMHRMSVSLSFAWSPLWLFASCHHWLSPQLRMFLSVVQSFISGVDTCA